MRSLLVLFFLNFLVNSTAQTEEFIGIYIFKADAENAVIQHKMVLEEEGKFLFSTFFSPKDRDGKMMEIRSDYGSGQWRANGDQVFFQVDSDSDFDKDRTLDFSNTRARLEKPSPRNLKGEKGPILLVFFDSDIPWVKGLRLPKQ
ncbi:MAG: hypothetical protein R3356_07130 [Eudoraea sp.]|nr:hypothetical protein [Eudoraea sp.]